MSEKPKPNLQNIPIRTEAGRRLAAEWTLRAPTSITAVDFSELELRVLASLGIELKDPK